MKTAERSDIFASSSYTYMMRSIRMQPRGKVNILKDNDHDFVKQLEFNQKNFTVNGKKVTELMFFTELSEASKKEETTFAINW